ncbi:MAG TPA: hypothetical protein VFG99_07165, partial [Chloroflexia bacterium]|nr:hypothetical protein [Chloroflexia bacterium]
DFFASQDLLQATGWWEEARVLVLDEFDPARLLRTVPLDSHNLARMSEASDCAYAQSVLRWLGMLLGKDGDRTLAGPLLLQELATLAASEQLDLEATLHAARAALPPQEEVHLLPGVPQGATEADYAALPPNYLATIITLLDDEYRTMRSGKPFTSRLEATRGQLWLYLRLNHLIAQLARPEQPKLILDATANPELLAAIFPGTPLQIERPTIAGGAQVVQVISRDWAKSTLHGPRREQWYAEVADQIRPDRPTLVVCTQACETDLRAALAARGHDENVVVAHYGALRGSNAYKGYDVILAQVYHPNLEALIREGRALFADDDLPLDERVVTTERVLEDAAGARWVVQVPTFADSRLAALLEQRREAELVQAALRGRPFDHPDAQITLLFGLPLQSLPPTSIREAQTSADSNTGRQERARAAMLATVQQALTEGKRVLSVEDVATASGLSVVTIRKHAPSVASCLGLRLVQQRRVLPLPQGGQRMYRRMVLLQRGRRVPLPESSRVPTTEQHDWSDTSSDQTDQARNTELYTRVIYAYRAARPSVIQPRRCKDTLRQKRLNRIRHWRGNQRC